LTLLCKYPNNDSNMYYLSYSIILCYIFIFTLGYEYVLQRS